MKRDYLLTKEEVKALQPNTFYGLFAEPGAGKTQTFKDIVIPAADEEGKSILFLAPRNSLKEQTEEDTDEIRTSLHYGFGRGKVYIANYQHIQSQMEKGNKLPEYDYIICDEAHYFVQDHWNEKTYLAAQYLEQSQAVKLLMTGTPGLLTHYASKWHVQTLREPDRSNTDINRIELYSNEKQMKQRIRSIQSETCKVLTFKPGKITETKKFADELSGSFLCSENNKQNMYEHVDQKLAQAIRSTNKSLPTENIVSTSIIEEGINIKDPNFQIVASFEPKLIENVIQQASRIRRDDKVTLLIYVDNVQSYTGLIRKNKDEMKNGSEAKKALLSFQNEQLDSINQMAGNSHIERYQNYLEQYFPATEIVDMDKEALKETIENRLSSLVGQEIYKEDINNTGIVQADLINIFVEEFGTRGSKRQKKISKKRMADFLEEYNVNLSLISKQNKTLQQTYWKVI